MTPITEIKTRPVLLTYLCCAACGGDVGTIDHLAEYKELNTTWACKACGVNNDISVRNGNVVAQTIADEPEYTFKTLSLLQVRGMEPPVRFLVEGIYSTHDTSGRLTLEELNNKRYYYNEHTCPINWLGVEKVELQGDLDPHDAFQFLAAWGPGDTDAIEMVGFDSEEIDTDEVKLGGEDIFGNGDEKELLVKAWIEMYNVTMKLLHKVINPDVTVAECLDPAREWVNLYGTNPRAWFLLACYHEERSYPLDCVGGVWAVRINGRMFVYNEATGELTIR